MTGVDIVLCIMLLVGCVSGYRDGFLMGVFSFLAIVLGVLGAFKLMGLAIVFLATEFDIDQKFLPYIAFAVVFLAIVIAVRLLGNVIKLSIDKTFLGTIDQFAGAILGLFKTLFIVSVLLWIVDSLNFSLPENWTGNSWILPYVQGFAPVLADWISEIFPVFNDIF